MFQSTLYTTIVLRGRLCVEWHAKHVHCCALPTETDKILGLWAAYGQVLMGTGHHKASTKQVATRSNRLSMRYNEVYCTPLGGIWWYLWRRQATLTNQNGEGSQALHFSSQAVIPEEKVNTNLSPVEVLCVLILPMRLLSHWWISGQFDYCRWSMMKYSLFDLFRDFWVHWWIDQGINWFISRYV